MNTAPYNPWYKEPAFNEGALYYYQALPEQKR